MQIAATIVVRVVSSVVLNDARTVSFVDSLQRTESTYNTGFVFTTGALYIGYVKWTVKTGKAVNSLHLLHVLTRIGTYWHVWARVEKRIGHRYDFRCGRSIDFLANVDLSPCVGEAYLFSSICLG